MDFTSLIKKGQPSVEPHELTLVEDTTDILYDKRIELPLDDRSILNLAAVGQAQPVSVRPRGFDDLVPVDKPTKKRKAA